MSAVTIAAASGGRVDRAIARLRPAGSWTEQGACRTADPESFYSSDETIFAKAVCSRCPVVDKCLDWALESREPHGVWGGLDEQERKALTLPNTVAAQRRQEALTSARLRAAAARRATISGAPREDAMPPAAQPARTVPGLLSQAEQGAAQRGAPAKPDPALAVSRAKASGTPVIVRVTPSLPGAGRSDRRRPLCDRGIEVLAGLASGRAREKAAADLGISAATFKTHVGRMTEALGSRGSAHSVALGYAYGYLRPNPVPRDQLPEIGERPLEVVCRLAAGGSNGEIAKEMFLSEDTVKTHLRRLMKRFDAATRAALVDRLMHCGLLLAVLDEGEARR
jgi:DNA-binding CsgD family transcriptional regulator